MIYFYLLFGFSFIRINCSEWSKETPGLFSKTTNTFTPNPLNRIIIEVLALKISTKIHLLTYLATQQLNLFLILKLRIDSSLFFTKQVRQFRVLGFYPHTWSLAIKSSSSRSNVLHQKERLTMQWDEPFARQIIKAR